MLSQEIQYLDEVVRQHVCRFFTNPAQEAFEKISLRWCSINELISPVEKGLYVPTDIPAGLIPNDVWKVPFGDTQLTLWNRLTPPSVEWNLLDPSAPLWYVHPCGAVMPAWNLAPTLFNLLTLKEEKEHPCRDLHGRFIGKMSARDSLGLLEAPIFNDSVAAIVAICIGLKGKGILNTQSTQGLVKKPYLTLSHDLDQLRGNDLWTQGIRLSRALTPKKWGLQGLHNIWLILYNLFLPRRYFFDNIVGMIEIERMLGFTSSLYFLNGTGGRFGARSGPRLIDAIAKLTPVGWDLGIHYNYDTHINPKVFFAQRSELEMLLGHSVKAGRSHYLRFDPTLSLPFYANMGMQADETLGYPDRIGYRAGISGPFHPYDPVIGKALALVEMPMVIMDGVLVHQYPLDPVGAFERHLRHISIVGGALSLLFHPGQFHNPEYPEMLGLYRRLLGVARLYGARSINVSNY